MNSKNLMTGLIVGMGILLATVAYTHGANSTARIMVPATIDGYDTVELLQYVATLKAASTTVVKPTPAPTPIIKVAKTREVLMAEYENAHPRPINGSRNPKYQGMSTTQMGVQYYHDYLDWITAANAYINQNLVK